MFPGDRMLILDLTGAHIANRDGSFSVRVTQLVIFIPCRAVMCPMSVAFIAVYASTRVEAGLTNKLSSDLKVVRENERETQWW